jgi:hypothetical protein
MRYSLVMLLVLTGCTHTVTLFERGGTEQALGTLNDGSKNMEVQLKGETYTGHYVLGQTTGTVMAFSTSGAPVFGVGGGTNNNASALLVGNRGGVLRCEFRIQTARGGNGVCIDRNNTAYDMLIKH